MKSRGPKVEVLAAVAELLGFSVRERFECRAISCVDNFEGEIIVDKIIPDMNV